MCPWATALLARRSPPSIGGVSSCSPPGLRPAPALSPLSGRPALRVTGYDIGSVERCRTAPGSSAGWEGLGRRRNLRLRYCSCCG